MITRDRSAPAVDMITYRRTRLQRHCRGLPVLTQLVWPTNAETREHGRNQAPFDDEDAVQKDFDIINAKEHRSRRRHG